MSPNALLIGARNTDDGRNFTVDGVIDNVSVWSRTLSAEEIAADWNAGGGRPAPGDVLGSQPTTMTIDVASTGAYQMQAGESIVVASDFGFETIRGANGVETVTLDLTGRIVKLSGAGAQILVDIDNDGDTELTISAVEKLVVTGSGLVLAGDLTAGGLSADPIVYNGDNGANLVDARGPTSAQRVTANGAGGADTLYGGAGADLLNGGVGVDAMTGGAGNDTYLVDNASDTVVEAAGAAGGVADLVKTGNLNYALGANVEDLTLTGTLALGGKGNAQANTITGNTAANQLEGWRG